MAEVTKSSKIPPPKQGLTKVQQKISSQGSAQVNLCPCAEVCQKLGTFKQGSCFLGTADTHKCLVANNLLLAKSSGVKK